MKTAYLQWITLPVSISCYCFVCTQANSGSVYYIKNTVRLILDNFGIVGFLVFDRMPVDSSHFSPHFDSIFLIDPNVRTNWLNITLIVHVGGTPKVLFVGVVGTAF
jgi:hypothetical protein